MRKPGLYVPINEERVRRLRDPNGSEVGFEELVVNGRTTGFVRCTSLRCQTMMMKKIKKQVRPVQSKAQNMACLCHIARCHCQKFLI